MLSGTGSVHLDDAFLSHPEIAFLTARHEAAAAVMAIGSARVTNQLGVVVVTTGPGGINAAAGVLEAWVDAVAILVLSGQVENRHLARTRHFGVQGFDIVEVVSSFTKYAAVVREPATIRYHLEQAVARARAGRPGPVWLDIPADVQSALIELDALEGFAEKLMLEAPMPVAAESIDAALALLEHSSRPLLVLGQGVRQAGALRTFGQLARALDVPVIATRLAQDLLPYDLHGYHGQGGIRGRRHTASVMRRADLVLSFGASLAHGFVGEDFDAFAPDAQIVMVDIDPAELTKPGVQIDLPIQADVAEVLSQLLARIVRFQLPDYSAWTQECEALKHSHPTVLPHYEGNPINSYYFLERLEAHTDARHIFVSDAGSAYYITGQGLTFSAGQRELTSGAFATMGVALGLAIGASFTKPEAQVLVVTGDGSIELNIQELRTISQNRLAIKVFVINNGGYASIRASQDATCGGRYTDDQSVLDFARVAAAFDLPFHRLERYETLDREIAALLERAGPTLVEVVCDKHQEIVSPAAELAASADREPIR
jgi:acetolactate synthase-1/2/3 large subunit